MSDWPEATNRTASADVHLPAPPRHVFPVRRLILLTLALLGLYFVWPNLVSVFSQVPRWRSITWFWLVAA